MWELIERFFFEIRVYISLSWLIISRFTCITLFAARLQPCNASGKRGLCCHVVSVRSSVCLSGVCHVRVTHSLTAALDQLRVVASSTSNDPGPRSRQHQQIGQCLLPLAAANFSVDDPAGASSQQREECRCGLLLTFVYCV